MFKSQPLSTNNFIYGFIHYDKGDQIKLEQNVKKNASFALRYISWVKLQPLKWVKATLFNVGICS